VAEALAEAGRAPPPGAEVTDAEARAMRANLSAAGPDAWSHETRHLVGEWAGELARMCLDLLRLLDERERLLAIISDGMQDGALDAYRAGWARGREPLLALLRKLEWCGRQDGCPFCGGPPFGGDPLAHLDGCELAAALAEAAPTEGE
jgi:hypothetical protein